ncbi:MAG: putative rane protein [Polaromonas sp.]|nr:putative rane protein [Polaromonas sp.]
MNQLDLSFVNLVDIVLAAIVLLGIARGWSQGFVIATLRLFTLAASLIAAFTGYHYLAAWLEAAVPSLGMWAPPLGFLAAYVLTHLLIGGGAGALAGAFPRPVHAHGVNRALGIVPGLVNGAINAMLASLLLLTLPLSDRLSGMARDSALASRLAEPAQWLEVQLSPIFHPALQRSLQALTVPPEPQATRKLPYQVVNPKVRPDLEARMLEMVNAERAAQGLRPLQADPALAEVARAHSRDMFARSYFSHTNPDGQEPFDRMRQARVPYLVAGENLALAQTLPSAHQGLMNSPGHRANILLPRYGRVGIGVLDGGRYGLMVTQNFRN